MEFPCPLYSVRRNLVVMTRDELAGLVRTQQAELYRYVRYLGAWDRSLAEDLVQDTFLAAWRNPNMPEEFRRQSAYLRGIARNLFLAHCRRARACPVRTDSETVERTEAVWAGEFLRDGDGFDYLEALRMCLKKLDDRQRRFLDLRYNQGKSRGEMAKLMQMTEDGIKSGLQRIRQLLGACVQRRLVSDAS